MTPLPGAAAAWTVRPFQSTMLNHAAASAQRVVTPAVGTQRMCLPRRVALDPDLAITDAEDPVGDPIGERQQSERRRLERIAGARRRRAQHVTPLIPQRGHRGTEARQELERQVTVGKADPFRCLLCVHLVTR